MHRFNARIYVFHINVILTTPSHVGKQLNDHVEHQAAAQDARGSHGELQEKGNVWATCPSEIWEQNSEISTSLSWLSFFRSTKYQKETVAFLWR